MAATTTKKSVFQTLNDINVNEHTEKKNGLTYLSWAWAWAEVKKNFPDATYKIYENENGWNYFTDGRTAWVKTGVTIEGIENIEYLPVMDYRNRSIPLEQITSFDVNKSIQRSLTKACARHGLGLYVYQNEDLPEVTQTEKKEEAKKAAEDNMKKLVADAKAAASNVKSRAEFQAWWSKYPTLQQNQEFLAIAQGLGKKFPKNA